MVFHIKNLNTRKIVLEKIIQDVVIIDKMMKGNRGNNSAAKCDDTIDRITLRQIERSEFKKTGNILLEEKHV